MVLIILEEVPKGLRGELSRWMIEFGTGVFIGRLSAAVRDRLWEKCRSEGTGNCIQVYATNNEQGFEVRSYGPTCRMILDVEGIKLAAVQDAIWSKWMESTAAKGRLGSAATVEGTGCEDGGPPF
jgi:CRISPR-associated protein Cas2